MANNIANYSSPPKGQQWYNNKELFEMLQDLKEKQSQLLHELEITRHDLKQYNNLRKDIAELQIRQKQIADNCNANLMHPDGLLNQFKKETQDKINSLQTEWKHDIGSLQQEMYTEISKLKKQIKEYDEMIQRRIGRASFASDIKVWGGWVLSAILSILTIIDKMRVIFQK